MGASCASLPPGVVSTRWIILRSQKRPGPTGVRDILESACVCFSMFIHAALSSAVRSVSRQFPFPAPVPALDLSSSGGTASVDQDEFAEEPATFDEDLTFGRAHLRPFLPPPARGPLSPAQIRFRPEMLGTVQSLSAAPGTVRTYEAVLNSMAPRVVEKLGWRVLPMETANVFLAFLGSVDLFGPRIPSPPSVGITLRSRRRLRLVGAPSENLARSSMRNGCRIWWRPRGELSVHAFMFSVRSPPCSLARCVRSAMKEPRVCPVPDGPYKMGYCRSRVLASASVWKTPLRFVPPRRRPSLSSGCAGRPRFPSCPQTTSVWM